MRKQVTLEDVRSFTLEQFERAKKTCEIKKLVHFHTINKYLLMAHNQQGLRTLGKLVANKEKKPLNEILEEYEFYLNQILRCNPTVPSITNVFNKIYSHFRKKLTSAEKKLFLKTIEDFRTEKIPLGKVLNYVDSYVQKFENGYLQRQTFYLLYSDIEDENYKIN